MSIQSTQNSEKVTITQVYGNGDRVTRIGDPEEAESQIQYSLEAHPGCALFTNAECLSTGNLSQEHCDEISQELATNLKNPMPEALVPSTQEDFQQMMEILTPLHRKPNSFLVGEPVDFRICSVTNTTRSTFDGYFRVGENYFKSKSDITSAEYAKICNGLEIQYSVKTCNPKTHSNKKQTMATTASLINQILQGKTLLLSETAADLIEAALEDDLETINTLQIIQNPEALGSNDTTLVWAGTLMSAEEALENIENRRELPTPTIKPMSSHHSGLQKLEFSL